MEQLKGGLRFGLVAGLALSVASAGLGCSAQRENPRENPENVADSELGLSTFDPGCYDWANVHRTRIGGAELMSPETYDNATCFKAYLINLIDYDAAKYNGGAVVGYGGALPTTEAACVASLVRAIVWRKETSSMVLEGDKTVRGRWAVGFDGVGRCYPPQVHLESDLGIEPNGLRDYRIAVSARVASGSTAPTVPVGLVTIEDPVISPIHEVNNLIAYRQLLDSYSGTFLEPWLAALWNTRNTPLGQAGCRHLQVERGLHSFTRAAVIKAGAVASTVDARITALANLRTALCTTAGTTTTLYNSFKDYITRTISIRDQIANAILVEVPAIYGLEREALAANLMAQIPTQAIGALTSKCGLNVEPLANYLLHGTLPNFVTDPTRVVLGDCSGQSATVAASTIGFGTPTPAPGGGAANAVRAMAKCMAGLEAGMTQQRCQDPRAQDAPETPAPVCWDADTDETRECSPECYNEKTASACRVTDQPIYDAANTEEATQQRRAGSTTVQLIRAQGPAPQSTLEAIKEQAKEHPTTAVRISSTIVGVAAGAVKVVADKWATIPGTTSDEIKNLKVVSANAGLVVWTAAAVNVAAVVIDFLHDAGLTDKDREREEADVRTWCSTGPADPLHFCDHVGPGAYCPADPIMPSGGWYELGTGGPGERQPNVQDLFRHCICDMVDADYAAIGRDETPSRAPSATCPKSDDQRRLECVADPRLSNDPTDAPDPECFRLLQPLGDYDAWRAKDCWETQCDPTQRPFAMPNGQCQCLTLNPSGGKPDCNITPRASAGLCPAEDPNNCFCVPIAPALPNGADPLCRHNVTRLPGAISAWMTPDEEALHLAAFNASTDVIRMRAAGNTQVVSPTLFPNSFAQRGTRIRQTAVLLKAPTQGQNVDLKAYYTNRSKNLFRQFLGQCRMNSFTVGSITNCDFDLPTVGGVNAGSLEDPFEFELELNTAIDYRTRAGLGPLSFAGTLTNTPIARLAPICPDPSPANGLEPVDVESPWIDWVGGINPNQTYPIPNGAVLDIPLVIPVIR